MRPVASDYDGDSNRLTIDWMRLSPYAWTSTYLSAVFDAAAVTNWNPAAWVLESASNAGSPPDDILQVTVPGV